MSAISRFVEGRPAILWAHVFITTEKTDTLEFEVLEVNAGSLRQHIGKKQLLMRDGDTPFRSDEPHAKLVRRLSLRPDLPRLPFVDLMRMMILTIDELLDLTD